MRRNRELRSPWASLKHPSETGPGIAEAAKDGCGRAKSIAPYKVNGPATCRAEFHKVEEADMAASLQGVARVNGYTLECDPGYVPGSPLLCLQRFRDGRARQKLGRLNWPVQFQIDLEMDIVAYHDSARFEGLIPCDAELFSVDDAFGAHPDLVSAIGIGDFQADFG